MSINEHLKFLKSNISLFANGTSFYPHELNLSAFKSFLSKTNQKLLSRNAYLRREEIKDLLTRCEVIFLRLQELYPIKELEVELPMHTSWLIPMENKIGKGLKVREGEKFIFEDDKVYLLPGNIVNGVFKTSTLQDVVTELDKKTNYMNDYPVILFNDSELDLTTIKNKLIKYMRDRTRLLLRSDPESNNVRLYRLTREVTPLEDAIKKIYNKQDLQQYEKVIYEEFPLFGSLIHKEVTVYVEEDLMHIQSADVYFPNLSEEYLVLLNPVLVSEHKSDRFSTSINVDVRALHINYGFETRDGQGYEDFLFEPNWVLAPIILYKKSGNLQGKIIDLPNNFIDLLDDYLKKNCGEEKIESDTPTQQ